MSLKDLSESHLSSAFFLRLLIVIFFVPMLSSYYFDFLLARKIFAIKINLRH